MTITALEGKLLTVQDLTVENRTNSVANIAKRPPKEFPTQNHLNTEKEIQDEAVISQEAINRLKNENTGSVNDSTGDKPKTDITTTTDKMTSKPGTIDKDTPDANDKDIFGNEKVTAEENTSKPGTVDKDTPGANDKDIFGDKNTTADKMTSKPGTVDKDTPGANDKNIFGDKNTTADKIANNKDGVKVDTSPNTLKTNDHQIGNLNSISNRNAYMFKRASLAYRRAC